MPELSIMWLRVATALYSVGLLHAILTLLRRESRLFKPALGAFCVGVVLHMVALVQLGYASGSVPVNNFNESISFCAFLIAVAFLIVMWKYQFTGLAVPVFPLVFIMAQVGSMEFPAQSPGFTNPSVRNAWLLLHIALVLLGYAGLALTAVASIFYLIQERQLKSKRRSRIFDRLPPLGSMDNLITSSMGFGFVFITLGVIVGSTWAFIEFGTRWIAEPKIAISLITWALYVVMIFLRTTAGWRGRKAALMALSVLGFSALTWAAHAGLRPESLR